MRATGVVARWDANEQNREVGGSLLATAGGGLVAVGLGLMALALLLAILPITRPRSAPGDVDGVACGLPVGAVSRDDPGEGLAALGRLPASGRGTSEPSEEALARLVQLEREVEWYRACHRPAAMRMVGANALVAVGAAAALTGVLLRRRRGASAARVVTSVP